MNELISVLLYLYVLFGIGVSTSVVFSYVYRYPKSKKITRFGILLKAIILLAFLPGTCIMLICVGVWCVLTKVWNRFFRNTFEDMCDYIKYKMYK